MAEMTPEQEVAWQMAMAALKRARRGLRQVEQTQAKPSDTPEKLCRQAQLGRAWLAEVNKAYDAAMAAGGHS